MKWIIAIIALMLFITACSSEAPAEESTEEVPEEATNTIELRFIDNVFDPNTIVVNEGYTVRLQFMNVDPFMFSLPEFGIAEMVSGNNFIEFVADQKGFFDFTCDDCSEPALGVLKVI